MQLSQLHYLPLPLPFFALLAGLLLGRRTYAYRFIELCSPALPEKMVRAAVMADASKQEAKPEGLSRRAAAQLWLSSGNTLSRDEVKRTA